MARIAHIFDVDIKSVIAVAPFPWFPDTDSTDAIAIGDALYLVSGFAGKRIHVKRLIGELPETVRILWSLPTTKNDAARPRYRNEAGIFESPPAVDRKNARQWTRPKKPADIQPDVSI